MLSRSSGPPPPPPPGGHDTGIRPSHARSPSTASSVPPSGDGRTPQTAQYSLVLEQNPGEEFTYVLYHLGLSRWVRTVANEARIYAGYGYAVLDGYTYRTVAESDWAQGIPAAHRPAGAAFRRQDGEVDRVERTLNGDEDTRGRSTSSS